MFTSEDKYWPWFIIRIIKLLLWDVRHLRLWLTADLRSLSCLLGFFAREVMRVFILLKSSRKCYCSLKFIEVWICMCYHLSHKKIKVRNFCWYIQGLISSACWWFTSFLWMNFSELLLCSSLCQFNPHRTGVGREEVQGFSRQVLGEGRAEVMLQTLPEQPSTSALQGMNPGGSEGLSLDQLLPSSLCYPTSVLAHSIWRAIPAPQNWGGSTTGIKWKSLLHFWNVFASVENDAKLFH